MRTWWFDDMKTRRSCKRTSEVSWWPILVEDSHGLLKENCIRSLNHASLIWYSYFVRHLSWFVSFIVLFKLTHNFNPFYAEPSPSSHWDEKTLSEFSSLVYYLKILQQNLTQHNLAQYLVVLKVFISIYRKKKNNCSISCKYPSPRAIRIPASFNVRTTNIIM